MPLSRDDKKKYKSLYLQTARQYVLELQKNLSFLKSGKSSAEALDTLHRAAHSLNSQSVMMSYESISSVASLLEKLFDEQRGKKMTFTSNDIQVISEATAHMEDCLAHIDKEDQETDLAKDCEHIKKIAKQ